MNPEQLKCLQNASYKKPSPENSMACRFNSQNFLQQWTRTLHSRDKIDLSHYFQGQALISVQKLCWNCQRFMHLERDRTSQDGWRWYERFNSQYAD